MTDETYNGWANYETWATNLWLSNEEETYNLVRTIVRNAGDANPSRLIRESIEEGLWGDEAPASLGTDLVRNALDRVDWPAIVESFREE